MRIAMISYYHVSLESGGGVGVQIRKTVEYLRQKGVQVDLFDPWTSFSISDYDIYHFFPVHPFFEHFACKVLKPMGAKVVVSPVFWPQHSALLEGVWTRLSSLLPQMYSGRSLMRNILRSADLLLPNSEAEAVQINRIFGITHKKMRAVPNGTDLVYEHATPDLCHSRFPYRKFALYVGNIGYERKNHERLIQAWKNIDYDLVLAGNLLSTPYSSKVMEAIKENDSIHYLGFIDKDDPLLASLYAACEVFVLPGTFETPGLAALEAGIAGAKVAVTTGGSTREYFGEYADYLNPFSIASIQEAVLRAFSREKGPSLQNHLRKHYSWEHVAEATLEAYREVLS